MEVIEHIRFPTAICIITGLISLFYLRKLTLQERFIIVVIYLNISADILANYIEMKGMYNGDVYNIICPIEKIITIGVYYFNTKKGSIKDLYGLGVIAITSLSIGGYLVNPISGSFHTAVYLISGFIMAVLSYLHLRQLVLDKAKPSTPIFWFGMANLIYYTLMTSSVSAFPVAQTISDEFARQIGTGNQIAYVLWSLTTLIGIIWNRTKN